MTAHTPGPWNVHEDKLGGRHQFLINGPGGHPVAAAESLAPVYSGYGKQKDEESRCSVGQPVAWANARLIAAAPEMLEALRQIAWKLGHNGDRGSVTINRSDATIVLAEAAIAKAETR